MGYSEGFYEANREKILAKNKEWYLKNKGLVAERQKADRLARPEVYRERHRKYVEANLEKVSTGNRKWIERRREEVKNQLGGKCSRCGFEDKRALQVHHKEAKTKTGRLDYLVKGYDLTKVELICANCHQIEHYKFFRENNKKYV